MMKILEDALAYGSIHIGYKHGFLFRISYKSPGKETINKESDRGLPHLFLSLAAAISGNEQIKIEADEKYKYPLSYSASCTQERAIKHTCIHICIFEGSICVLIQKTDAWIADTPGVSSKQGHGLSIEEAFQKALEATPVPAISLRFSLNKNSLDIL